MRLKHFLCLLVATSASLAQAAGVTVQTQDIRGKNSRGEAYAKGQMTTPLVKAKPVGKSQPDDEANAKVADRKSVV